MSDYNRDAFDEFRDSKGDWHLLSPFEIAWMFWRAGWDASSDRKDPA